MGPDTFADLISKSPEFAFSTAAPDRGSALAELQRRHETAGSTYDGVAYMASPDWKPDANNERTLVTLLRTDPPQHVTRSETWLELTTTERGFSLWRVCVANVVASFVRCNDDANGEAGRQAAQRFLAENHVDAYAVHRLHVPAVPSVPTRPIDSGAFSVMTSLLASAPDVWVEVKECTSRPMPSLHGIPVRTSTERMYSAHLHERYTHHADAVLEAMVPGDDAAVLLDLGAKQIGGPIDDPRHHAAFKPI